MSILDKLNVCTRSAKLPVSSSNDTKQLKQVTRTSVTSVNQQPVKRNCRSLAVDYLPSDASNKVQY